MSKRMKLSKDEMAQELEKLRAHIADLIRSGRMTDGTALTAVALALNDQEWLPRPYIERKLAILTNAAIEIAKVSQGVIDEVAEAGRKAGQS